MPGNPTPQTLRALCRRISSERNLGWDAQKELYSRLTDRFSGYVSGTPKISPEGALVLTRKHFEDPDNIRDLLGDANAGEGRSDFPGRIATLLAATFCYGIVAEILLRLLFGGVYALSPAGFLNGKPTGIALALMDMLLPSLVLLAGFGFWRSTKEGRRYWFQNTGPYNIVTVIVLMVAVPEILWNVPRDALIAFRQTEYIQYGNEVCLALQCLVWMWWCDAAPRWKWGSLVCPVFWVFYEAAVHPLFYMFGLFTSPGQSSILIFEQRFLSNQVPVILRITGVSLVVYLLLRGLEAAGRRKAEAAARRNGSKPV